MRFALFMFLIVASIVGLCILSYNRLTQLSFSATHALDEMHDFLEKRKELLQKRISDGSKHEKSIKKTIQEIKKQENVVIADNLITSFLEDIVANSKKIDDLDSSFLKEFISLNENTATIKRFYNGKANELNSMLKTFPSKFIGSTFNIPPITPFDLTDDQAEGVTADWRTS